LKWTSSAAPELQPNEPIANVDAKTVTTEKPELEGRWVGIVGSWRCSGQLP
jgi:hypothetical protein